MDNPNVELIRQSHDDDWVIYYEDWKQRDNFHTLHLAKTLIGDWIGILLLIRQKTMLRKLRRS